MGLHRLLRHTCLNNCVNMVVYSVALMAVNLHNMFANLNGLFVKEIEVFTFAYLRA